MRTLVRKTVRCQLIVIIGLVINCGGIIDEDNPLRGVYYLESITAKLGPDKLLIAESPEIMGDLTVDDTSYNMYYGLSATTGDSVVDYTLIDRHFQGRFEFIGADRESLRLFGMPKVEPYYTDWWFHRSAMKLTIDNQKLKLEWLFRHY